MALCRAVLSKVAISADIGEMFLQLKVPENDRSAVRFSCWVENDERTGIDVQDDVSPI